MEIDKIYNMDCLKGMKAIPDGSIDLCVTDPPYVLETQGLRHRCMILFLEHELHELWKELSTTTNCTF